MEEGIKYTYNASGLVTEIQKNDVPLIKLYYNDRGHRVRKEIYNTSGSLTRTDYYVRDVAGSVLAIYNNSTLTEHAIYGSGRLGIYFRQSGSSVYQLTGHLGNVRAVVSSGGLANATDYYPGGMPMPNRQLTDGTYRYGYQGEFAETDPETGKPAFELRLYDPRINRWLTTDPYGEFHSPYLAMGNNWINIIDPDGRCTTCPDDANTGDTYNHPDHGALTFDGANWLDAGGNIALDGFTGTPNLQKGIGDFIGPAIGELSGISKFLAELEANLSVEDSRKIDHNGVTFWIDPNGFAQTNGIRIQGGSGALGFVSGGGVSKGIQFLRNPNVLKHIFRETPGHVNPQTITSQERYLKLFNSVINPNNLVETTNASKVKAGVETYHKTFSNGKQVWVEAIKGKITNAGINTIPR
ncbi:RHS repeat-associated core domain-containing protein [Leptobacterium sp. I13]|uniref:RHS repeat domain-containing protein n=1 Tax=Leptobacterium meishanense TaxID=3128904 RepID=UPI0030EE6CC0